MITRKNGDVNKHIAFIAYLWVKIIPWDLTRIWENSLQQDKKDPALEKKNYETD